MKFYLNGYKKGSLAALYLEYVCEIIQKFKDTSVYNECDTSQLHITQKGMCVKNLSYLCLKIRKELLMMC